MATVLDYFGLGRLRDYDVAELRSDWRERMRAVNEDIDARADVSVIEIDVWY